MARGGWQGQGCDYTHVYISGNYRGTEDVIPPAFSVFHPYLFFICFDYFIFFKIKKIRTKTEFSLNFEAILCEDFKVKIKQNL